jgi:fucose 4-O-acetylase-like acetyltransferase
VYVSPPTSTAAAASPGQEQRRPQHPPASRDSFFDNAKILTLVLVVSGHFWEPLVQEPGHRFIHAAYLLVYTFHMPVFVFISGYFSRSFSAQPRQLRRLLTGVLIPYLVWSTLLDLFTNWALHSHTPVNPLVPTWITWFLLSLFLWRLTAPLWKIIKAPIAIAMAISVAAGAFPVTAELSIARTLQFLPFFVAGMTLGPEHVARIKDSRALSVAALPVFAVAAAVCYWAVPHAPISWFYRTGSTAGLHVGFARWAVESLAINLGGAVLGVLFLAIVPRQRSWITRLGAASMFGFLLHPFIQRTLIHEDVYAPAFTGSAIGLALLTALAIAVALTLCTPVVAKVMRPLVEPRLRWLFRDTPSEVHTGSIKSADVGP